MIDDSAVLRTLSHAYGIDTDYFDVWGGRHEVPASTHQALLRALGLALERPEEELQRLADAPWKDLLDPVHVRTEAEQPAALLLRLPAPASTLSWTLRGATGTVWSGQAPPDALDPTGEPGGPGNAWQRYRWYLPNRLAAGHYALTVCHGGVEATTLLVIVPERCYQPPLLENNGRVWGFAIQLYALRSYRNWGIGDFGDLALMVATAARLGAAVIGVNPLHALFLHNPDQASPYSPSSRLFLNPLYVDIEAIPEFVKTPAIQALVRNLEFQERLERLRAAPLVDYYAVWAAKKQILERLYQAFMDAADAARTDAFSRFKRRRGAALFHYALHETLQEHFYKADPSVWGWPVWPEPFREVGSPEVQAFAERYARRVDFYRYLQWQAEEQLDAVGAQAQAALGIGLYRDLAVGVDRAGAETWADPTLYLGGASVGCPPDEFNQKGQNWGLPPLSAAALKERCYRPFIDTLEANMRAAGALRLDHVMGLFRLFLVPDQASALAGTYVHYPMEDLFRLLAESSTHHRCLIIGEDLGTVPPAIHEAMERFGLLSYRLLYFEQDAHGFRAPEHYPVQALVTATTHDLPTLNGFWQGLDLAERSELQLFPTPALEEQQRRGRTLDRERLWSALKERALVPAELAPPVAATPLLVQAVYRYLARTPAKLLLVQLEDLLLAEHAVNLPGTVGERPNWRRKLELPLEDLPEDRLAALADAMRQAGRAP